MAHTSSVYQAIRAVSADLAKLGYPCRGIDEVLNALAPILVAQGLVILPRILSRTAQSLRGGERFSVVVEAEFDLVAAIDSSCHTIRTFGEAIDATDKATTKAMSAAYQDAAVLAFCIPLAADETTPEGAA